MDDKQRLLDRHNCQQLMRKVMLLLDGEMSEAEEKIFLLMFPFAIIALNLIKSKKF